MAFQDAMASLSLYVVAGKLKPFKGDALLVPGIKAQAAAGHTPEHSTFVVESKGQKLVLWGDLMHVAAVQFAQPAVTIAFDTDSKAAAAQRLRASADAAKNGNGWRARTCRFREWDTSAARARAMCSCRRTTASCADKGPSSCR